MDCRNVVVFDDTQQILSHLVRRGFMKDYLIWTKHGEGSSAPYTTGNPANIDVDGADMLVSGFQFVHETQQPNADGLDTEHVVPNVPDHGFTGGNESVRTNVLPNNMSTEDTEFLGQCCMSCGTSINVLHQRYGGPNEGSRRAFVR
jgi:hypothetical protein